MNKAIKRIISIVMCLLLLAGLYVPVEAASCRFSFSDPKTTVGKSFSVSMSSSVSVASFKLKISYDSSMLTFNSGSGNTSIFKASSDGSVILVYGEYSEGEGKISCSLNFTAKKAGSTSLKVTYMDASDAGGDSLEVSAASSAITIEAAPTASSDAKLKSLSVSPGTLSPKFSADTTSYKVSVANSVTKLTVSAKANHSAAKVSVSGNSGLDVGDNTVKVKVTAEDGSTQTYKIVVTRAKKTTDPETETESEKESESESEKKLELKVGSQTLAVMEPDSVPKGFTEGKKTGTEAPVYTHKNTAVFPLVYGKVGKNDVAFYHWDDENGLLIPYKTMKIGKTTLTVLVGNKSFFTMDGYKKGTMKVGENEMTVYLPEEGDANHALLTLGNDNGDVVIYLYDPQDETLQRYNFIDANGSLVTMSEEYQAMVEQANLLIEENAALKSEKQALQEELASYDEVKAEYEASAEELEVLRGEREAVVKKAKLETWIMYGTVGLCGVLAVALIAILVKRKG